MYLDRLFKLMAEKQASDLFISCGAPINIKVNGVVQPFMQVHPRKYRFRCLNGGPSRFYQLFLTDIATADIRRERVALPLLRDERPEFQVRELSRIVAERAGQG